MDGVAAVAGDQGRPPIRALVLAGGGLKVAFQAGVLQVLLDEARTADHGPLTFPVADGASGGTFNLAMLCQGLSGQEIADRWRRTRPLAGVSLNWRQWLPVPMSVFTYDGFRRHVLNGTWGLDWHRIRTTELRATFNMFDVDDQHHQHWAPSSMHERALIAAVTLPMWFPPIRLPHERGMRRYIDAVFATNANLEAAIENGADELWVIWTESQRGHYRRGFVAEYFQMIEAVSNSRVRAVVDRIQRSNAAGEKGEFGRHIKLCWLSAEVPAHYLFSLSRTSMAEAVARGVTEGRKWCQTLDLGVEPILPPPTGGELTFREHLKGAFDFGADDPEKNAALGAGTDTALSARLKVTIPDVDRFITDERHQGQLEGSIRCPAFGGERRLSRGIVELLWDRGDPIHKRLTYWLHFEDHDGRPITVFGVKYVVNEGRLADLWADTTTLYVHLYRGCFTEARPPSRPDLIGCGVLAISLGSFLRQLTTFRGTAGSSGGAVRTVARFGRFFARQLWQVYGSPRGRELLPSYVPPYSPPDPDA